MISFFCLLLVVYALMSVLASGNWLGLKCAGDSFRYMT